MPESSTQKVIAPKSAGEMHTPNLFLEIGTRIAHYSFFPPINTVCYLEHPRKRKNSKLIPTIEERLADAIFLKSNVFLITCCLFLLLFLMFLILNLYSCIRASNHLVLVYVLLCLLVVQCSSPPVLIICSLYYISYTRQMHLIYLCSSLPPLLSFLFSLLSYNLLQLKRPLNSMDPSSISMFFPQLLSSAQRFSQPSVHPYPCVYRFKMISKNFLLCILFAFTPSPNSSWIYHFPGPQHGVCFQCSGYFSTFVFFLKKISLIFHCGFLLFSLVL